MGRCGPGREEDAIAEEGVLKKMGDVWGGVQVVDWGDVT